MDESRDPKRMDEVFRDEIDSTAEQTLESRRDYYMGRAREIAAKKIAKYGPNLTAEQGTELAVDAAFAAFDEGLSLHQSGGDDSGSHLSGAPTDAGQQTETQGGNDGGS